jgi:cytochrome c-type biogenesis protein CcmF
MDAATIGTVTLWAAIACAVVAVVAGLAAPETGLPRWALLAALGMAATATLTLLVALIGGDFALDYVALTTSRATPVPYRFAALWGAMDGSLLFYATLTLAVGAVATRRMPVDLRGIATAVAAAVGCGLLLVTAVLATPFDTLAIPAVDGQGLLAILQHPAMVYHPPILYLGLTVLVAPFAITVAAVARDRVDLDWLRLTRRWMLVSWTLLALGMVAGANWAYVELGWGGFWAWDPVENTGLMPWLAATVFLHTSQVQRRDGRLARWNVAFALAPFVLTVLGVYLTRSGATGSIHSFAESTTIGRILLGAAVVVALFAAAAVVRTAGAASDAEFQLLGRDTWLTANGALLAVALLVVVVGSAYPAYLEVFLDQEVSVPARFFVAALVPIAVVLLLAVPFALRTRWNARRLSAIELAAFAAVAVCAALLAAWLADSTNVAGLVVLGLAVGATALLIVDLVRRRPRGRTLAAHLAHLGIVLVLFGGAASSLGTDFEGAVGVGDRVDVGPYTVRVDEIGTGEGDRYSSVGATVSLLRNGTVVDSLRPEIRAYEEQPLPIPEPALRSTLRDDVVVSISRVTEDASRVWLSVFLRPMVLWVWIGSLLLALAGLIALLSKDGGGAAPRRAATAARRAAGTASGG